MHIPLNLIDPDPNNPRKVFVESELTELQESISNDGLIQPIVVRIHPSDSNRFMIVAGERRFRAFVSLGCDKIPAFMPVEKPSEGSVMFSQVTENIQRKDLNPIERAEAFARLVQLVEGEGESNPQKEVARRLGISHSWLNRSLSVLSYDERFRALALRGLVKDLPTLKRLSKLEEERKIKAIEMIESGTWKASDFFGKKPSLASFGGETQEKKSRAKPCRLKVSAPNQWLKLIEMTPFSKFLDQEHPGWREGNRDQIQSYLDELSRWLEEDSPGQA